MTQHFTEIAFAFQMAAPANKMKDIFLLFALQPLEHVSIRVMWKYSIFNTNCTCTIVFFLIFYIFRTGQPYFVIFLNRRMLIFTVNNISWEIPHPRSEHVVRCNAVTETVELESGLFPRLLPHGASG